MIFEYHAYQYYRCQLCSLVSTYPIPDVSEIEAHYTRKFKSGNYQTLLTFSQEYSQVYAGFVQILTRRLEENGLSLAGEKILDVGCFTGEFLELLQLQGADVYGVELQRQAAQIANSKLPGKIFEMNVDQAVFPKMQFNIITLLGVLEHVADPVGLLRRSFELLYPGGWLMIQTPNSTSFFARSMRKFWPPYAPIEHIHLFSRRSLLLALENLGFENIVYQAHWKQLPIAYVFNMLQNYGQEFQAPFKIINHLFPKVVLPFYIGEMIVTAQKYR
jgi:2-polyprenyl-3-methyl-5-hydroxy-6-metoxy-1,4-benzoquinol methylase